MTTPAPTDLELTILMPCLNEAETLEVCIRKAQGFLQRSGIRGEVLISDNGSTDGSQAIAERLGARVSHAPRRGYGAALINGIDTARGRFVIMADADDSYDFENLEPFVERLRAGADLVMGNRFRGGIAPGAMPPLHKYLGNPCSRSSASCSSAPASATSTAASAASTAPVSATWTCRRPGWSSPPRWWCAPRSPATASKRSHDPQERRSLSPAAPAQLA